MIAVKIVIKDVNQNKYKTNFIFKQITNLSITFATFT